MATTPFVGTLTYPIVQITLPSPPQLPAKLVVTPGNVG